MAALKRRGIPGWVSRALAVNTKISVSCGQAGPYATYIEEVNPGKTLTIAAPMPGGEPLVVGKGEQLQIEIIAPQGVARFPAKLLRRSDTPTPVLIVSFPTADELEVIQRRRSVRVPVLLPLRCRKTRDRDGNEVFVRTMEGFAVDLSAKGLRMVTAPAFETGDQVLVSITFPWGEETLTGQIVVRFTASEEEEDEQGQDRKRAEEQEQPALDADEEAEDAGLGEDGTQKAAAVPEGDKAKKGDSEPPEDDEPKRVDYGVEFLNVEQSLEEKIYRYLFERQAELRRKGAV